MSNIPIFIPHEGCPHDCVFCSQEKITGVKRGFSDEIAQITAILQHSRGCKGEIAFFGGSFTAIGIDRMTALLQAAQPFLGDSITGIRISTRPDFIDDDICALLRSYNVSSVELGIQSASDTVLAASRRGHTAQHSQKACEIVLKHGFSLTGQMMIGLPCSTAQAERQTAESIVRWGADSARIYPTAVFQATALWDMAERGEYQPLTLADAVERTADCAEIFIKNNLKLLKIGLHASPELQRAKGANHPALGELVAAKIYLRKILKQASGFAPHCTLTLYVPSGAVSKAVGHKRENLKVLENAGYFVKIIEDSRLAEFEIRMTQD